MTQREKLVKLLMLGFIAWQRNKKKRSIYEGFADYLLENGVIVPLGDYEDKDGEQALKKAMNDCYYHNNAVTRYTADAIAEKLTKEEAEKALAKQEGGQ